MNWKRRMLALARLNAFATPCRACSPLVAAGTQRATSAVIFLLTVFGGYAYQGTETVFVVTWSLTVVAVYYFQIAVHPPMHDNILHEVPTIASRLHLLFLYVLPYVFLSLRLFMLLAELFVAFRTSVILFTSNFHQDTADLAAVKRSPVVCVGTRGAAALL